MDSRKLPVMRFAVMSLLLSLSFTASGQTVISTKLTAVQQESRNLSSVSMMSPDKLLKTSPIGNHGFSICEGGAQYPSVTVTNSTDACNGHSVAFVKFRLAVEIPANTTYEITHNFLISTYHDGASWSFAELQCYDDSKDSPDYDTYINFDQTSAATGVTYSLDNGRAYTSTDKYEKQVNCSRTLKYINLDASPKTMYKYFIFVSYANGKNHSQTARCELQSSTYVENLVPLFALGQTYNYHETANATGSSLDWYDMQNLKNTGTWHNDNSASGAGWYRSSIDSDNRTIRINQGGIRNYLSQGIFQVFSASINIPAYSDYMAKYNFRVDCKKDQTEGATWYIYEMFDLGEDPASMFDIKQLNLKNNADYSDPDRTLFRKFYKDTESHKFVNNPLYVRYTNRTDKATSKKHYFGILVYNIKSSGNNRQKRISVDMSMEDYQIFPTVSLDKLNQFSSDKALGNMSLDDAIGLAGMGSSSDMSLSHDPRTMKITTSESSEKAHLGYLPYTLTETLEPGIAELDQLYEYRTTLYPGSFTGSAWQTAEIFNFGADQPAVENLDLGANSNRSSSASLFKTFNNVAGDSVVERHRVVVPFKKTGNAGNKEFVDVNMALVTATPTTGSQKPEMESKLLNTSTITKDATIWFDMSQSMAGGHYQIYNSEVDGFSIIERDNGNATSYKSVPFTVSMYLSPGASIWKLVSFNLGIEDAGNNAGQSNGYVELLNFGDSEPATYNLNTASDANPSNNYSEYRIYHKRGYHNSSRTVNILMHFENNGTSDATISKHLALVTGTNDTIHSHQFKAGISKTAELALGASAPVCTFVDSWQEAYGYYDAEEDDKNRDIKQSEMHNEDDAWAGNTSTGQDYYALFEDPTVTTGSVNMYEMVNNGNNARLLKFTLAAVVPAHSTLDANMAAWLYAMQHTDSNPQFSAELFYFGDSDHCDDLTFNVVGKLGEDSSGNAVTPVNCYPSDYAYSKVATFGNTAHQQHYTMKDFDVRFVNDSDEPKIIRHYMGLFAYCQYCDREQPWYKFWKDDVPLQHKMQVLASIYAKSMELNHSTEFEAELRNAKATNSNGFNDPVQGVNSISTQESSYSSDNHSQAIEFDMVHTTAAGSTDNVQFEFTLKNLIRSGEHERDDADATASASLYYQQDGDWAYIGGISNEKTYSQAESKLTCSLPFVNNGTSSAEISRHFKLVVNTSDENHLSLCRLDVTSSVGIKDGDFSYHLFKDAAGNSYAKIVGFGNNSMSLSGNTLPETCTVNGTKYPVTTIGSGALSSISNTELTIPASITAIESGAFTGCSNLQTMTFAENAGTPCTIYATHSSKYIDDNMFNMQAQYSVNSGSIAAGCPNLSKVIFNRTVNAAETNGNSVACSPFVSYTNEFHDINDDVFGWNGLLGFMSFIVDVSFGTYVTNVFSSPVKEFVFTDKAGNIGDYICMHADKAAITFERNAEGKLPAFNSIGNYAFCSTGLRSFDFSMANVIGHYAFSSTPIKEIEITPNVSQIGLVSIATDSLMELKIDYSPVPIYAYGGDRWGNNGILDPGLDSYTCQPNSGEWQDYPVTFLTSFSLNRDITLIDPNYGNISTSTPGPFQGTMFEQNKDYSDYSLGNELRRINPSSFKLNNFEYFDIGNSISSIGSQGMAVTTLHSLKIGIGLTSLEEHAFVAQTSYLADEYVEKLFAALKEDALKDAWWNDLACVYSNSNFDINSALNYIWYEWTNDPIIHDIYCEAIADKQATPTTTLEIFSDTTYASCVLRYTSPGLTDHYPWNQFRNTIQVVTMDEDQYYFRSCADETWSEDLRHEFKNAEVQLRRSYKKGWNTICVPFDCTADALADGLVPYTLKGVIYNELSDNDTIGSFDLDFERVEAVNGKYTIMADTPYLIWFDSDIDDTVTTILTEMEFAIDHGKKLEYSVKDELTGATVTMCGTYEQGKVDEGNFILSGGKFYEVDSYVGIKAFRAWFHGDDGKTSQAPRRMRFMVNGKPLSGSPLDDDEEIKAEPDDESLTGDGYYYDAFGRKVTTTLPGRKIYIHNGRKVLVD